MDAQFLQSRMAIVPGAVSVTLTQNRGGTPTTTTIHGAIRRPVSLNLEIYAGVQLQGDEIIWKLPANLVTGEVLQGDTITDAANVVWANQSAKLLLMGTQWECVCRQAGK